MSQSSLFENLETSEVSEESEIKTHRNNQTKLVFDYLLSGKKIDSIMCRRFWFNDKMHTIQDLSPRIAKLKDVYNVAITSEIIPNAHGQKVHFMTPAQIELNKNIKI